MSPTARGFILGQDAKQITIASQKYGLKTHLKLHKECTELLKVLNLN
jgi:hypothetical protein